MGPARRSGLERHARGLFPGRPRVSKDRPSVRAVLQLCLLAAALAAPGSAVAQTSPPITDNKYGVELFNGPYFGPSRGASLGGAVAANASGVDAISVNPASPAVRSPYSIGWIDYDVNAGISFPGAFFVKSDFYNREPAPGRSEQRTRGVGLLNLGLALQFGNLAIAASTDQYQHEIAIADPRKPDVTVAFGRSNLVAAYGFFANQLVVGAGLRLITASFSRAGAASKNYLGAANNALSRANNVLDLAGIGTQFGAVLKLDDQPFRIGAAFRSPIEARPTADRPDTRSAVDGIARVDGFVLPERVTAPWELEVGGALQLGDRPLNPAWRNPRLEEAVLRHRLDEARIARSKEHIPPREERAIRRIEEEQFLAGQTRLADERRAAYRQLPRERLLLLASVLVSGATQDSVSVIGFAEQQREVVGRTVSLTPRVGIEGEPIANRLVTRAGSYLEPSRYAGGSYRQHFTAGAEVRLVHIPKIWLLQAFDLSSVGSFDVAPRYLNFGVSISFWH